MNSIEWLESELIIKFELLKSSREYRESVYLHEVYDLITDTGRLYDAQKSALGLSSYFNKGWSDGLGGRSMRLREVIELIDIRERRNKYKNIPTHKHYKTRQLINIAVRVRFLQSEEENKAYYQQIEEDIIFGRDML